MPVSRALVDALARRARRRKSRKGLQAARFPRQAEMDYVRSLTALSREVSELIRARVWPLLQAERQDALVGSRRPVPLAVTRVIEGLRVEIAEKVSGRARGEAGKMASRVASQSRKNLNDSYERVISVRPWESDDSLRGILASRVQANVDLITSIPGQQLDQVRDVITDGFAEGTRVETIQRQLQERFDVSESRAELIARDQVGKLNAELNQARQEAVGVTSYRWETSSDSRVRPMHAALDGTTHTWAEPPVTNEEGGRNHPGEDIQCRCNAVADIEGVLDRLGI